MNIGPSPPNNEQVLVLPQCEARAWPAFGEDSSCMLARMRGATESAPPSSETLAVRHRTVRESKGSETVLMESEGIIVSAGLQRLRESPYSAVRRLSCEFAGGVLTLRGNVASFFHKQVAQQSVARLEGVNQVDNQVEVM